MVACAIPEVNSCCYFISLRTGAKLCSLLAFVACLVVTFYSAIDMILAIRYVGDDGDRKTIVWELGLEIALQLMHMATSFCVIIGAYKERASLIRPWLFTAILTAVVEFFFMNSLVGQFIGFHHSSLLRLLYWPWTLASLLSLVDDVFGWFIVYSYYRAINTGNRDNTGNRNNTGNGVV